MLRRVTICPAFTPERGGSLHHGTLLGRFIYTNATTTEKPGTSPTSPAKCFSVLERILVPRQRLNEETEPGKAPDCLLGGARRSQWLEASLAPACPPRVLWVPGLDGPSAKRYLVQLSRRR